MNLTSELVLSRSVLLLHTLWWAAFLAGRWRGRAGAPAADAGSPPPEPPSLSARLLVLGHAGLVVLLYPAIWMGDAEHPALAAAGGLVILGAIGIAHTALASFASWRFAAALEEGHQLAESGPFALVRHPLYLAFFLLGLGSTLWIPTPATAAIAAALALIADVRARQEEALLRRAFGERYAAYQKRTWRLIPWIY